VRGRSRYTADFAAPHRSKCTTTFRTHCIRWHGYVRVPSDLITPSFWSSSFSFGSPCFCSWPQKPLRFHWSLSWNFSYFNYLNVYIMPYKQDTAVFFHLPSFPL
jgi:hypothetical protein